MSPIIWGIIALVLLFVLALFAKNRFDIGGKIDIFSVDDLMSAGVVGCLFGIVFFPFFVIYSLIWPEAKLPVEGNDPIWGRNVNKRVVEEAFLSVQKAKVDRDPKPLKDKIWKDVYGSLRSECNKLIAREETYAPQDIKIEVIEISNERIDKESSLGYVRYYFDACVIGTMVNLLTKVSDGKIVGGTADRVGLYSRMKFQSSPGDPFGGWFLTEITGPDKPEKALRKTMEPQ